MSGDLVDRLAQLGANGEDTASFLFIGTFPLGIRNTWGDNNEIFEGLDRSRRSNHSFERRTPIEALVGYSTT
jgi:hypothetical protein